MISVPISLLIASSLAQAAPATADPSIQGLAHLIGEWRFEDRSTPALGFDYVETGTRRCCYVLNDFYIRRISIGRSNGKERSYEFS